MTVDTDFAVPDPPPQGETSVALSDKTLLAVSLAGFVVLATTVYVLVIRPSLAAEETDERDGIYNYDDELDHADVRTLNRAQRRARARNRMKRNRRVDPRTPGQLHQQHEAEWSTCLLQHVSLSQLVPIYYACLQDYRQRFGSTFGEQACVQWQTCKLKRRVFVNFRFLLSRERHGFSVCLVFCRHVFLAWSHLKCFMFSPPHLPSTDTDSSVGSGRARKKSTTRAWISQERW